MVSLTPQSLYPLGKYRVLPPTGWPASQVWTLWRRENLCLPWELNTGLVVHSLDITLAEQSWP